MSRYYNSKHDTSKRTLLKTSTKLLDSEFRKLKKVTTTSGCNSLRGVNKEVIVLCELERQVMAYAGGGKVKQNILTSTTVHKKNYATILNRIHSVSAKIFHFAA